MQIQTTKLPQKMKNGAMGAKLTVASQEQREAEAPKESFSTTVKSEAFGEARAG